MRKFRYQRRQSRSAVWALRLGVFAVILLALAFVLHRFWTLETPDLVLVAGLSAAIAILALVCAAKGFRNLWTNGDKGGARSFWGGIFAFAVLLPIGLVAALWYASPPLYDLSTDFETPPQFPANMPPRLQWMNPLTLAVSGDALAQLTAYPDVVGRRYEAAPDRVAQGVGTVLKAFGWQESARNASPSEQNATRFAVTAHSFVLGLKSDIVIRLLDEGEATYVDVRSLSRYGKRDMGLNAGFITDFLGALESEVNKAPADVE
ncbi:hypothetical protein FHS76_003341 [Ochrobactrum daejeonense]|uniref:DUF1499 domain-containing protein n=1 Tax=Brucella daejeonensis TaxID=659015 RepID=A0A7W9EMG9_9HYPH|nr:DUF1499 domain-containing protein [Brucella daejeonensis]MBB5703438.1 hypothetical protein [Brucella daejeonensis]NKB78707.1 DUF1499 domain-containing protein [Brucella daejeonensis]